jgi:hypothetical protein
MDNHKLSIEMLYHYSCGSCGKWWSIGDHPSPTLSVTCPLCGVQKDVVLYGDDGMDVTDINVHKNSIKKSLDIGATSVRVVKVKAVKTKEGDFVLVTCDFPFNIYNGREGMKLYIDSYGIVTLSHKKVQSGYQGWKLTDGPWIYGSEVNNELIDIPISQDEDFLNKILNSDSVYMEIFGTKIPTLNGKPILYMPTYNLVKI